MKIKYVENKGKLNKGKLRHVRINKDLYKKAGEKKSEDY